MATLQKGDDVRVALSPFVINSLKKQGYKEVSDATTTSVAEPTESPEDEANTKNKNKGGKKS